MNKHILPDLTYAYNALEPYIDAKTMEIHHGKHHATYVNKLNAALERHPEFFEVPIENLLANLSSVPEEIRNDVRNNGGGHLNHSMFWKIMGRDMGGSPLGSLSEALARQFDSIDAFKKNFENAATRRFGSGWAWLSMNALGKLIVHSTANQDSPIMEGLIPVIGLDVWEHAYYLTYQNRRPDYISAFWRVINWKQAEMNYKNALNDMESCFSVVSIRKAS
jgi:Fe-Mn family superoxide dismutase